MKLSEIEWTDVELEPQKVRSQKLEKLSGIISVSSRSFVFDAVKFAQAKQTSLEPEIKLLLDKNVFSYIRLPVSIRPRGGYDIRFVSVELDLISENDQAICWSMEPSRIEQEVKLKTESELSGGLKLEALDLSAKGNISDEFVVYQPNIIAYNIGRVDPVWEFTPTEGRELNGIYILHMVVLVPKNTLAAGKVVIKADIFKEGWLWKYHARKRDEGGNEVLRIDLPGFSD